MKQLIVNADDFGYTRGVNRAILHAYRNGIVTSTSLLANGRAFEDAVEQAKSEPGLDVGCHLNLVEGAPLSPPGTIPHLVGADGKFHSMSGLALRLLSGSVPAAEIERECSAQLEKLFQAGIRPSHVDTHQHTQIHPRAAAAVATAARRCSIGWIRRPFENCRLPGGNGPRLRSVAGWLLNFLAPRYERQMAAQGLRMPDVFTGFSLTGRWTARAMEETLSLLPQGITELMCHPGYHDAELDASRTRLKRERQAELEIMANGAWRARTGELGITLTGFRGIPLAPARASGNPVLAVAPAGGE